MVSLTDKIVGAVRTALHAKGYVFFEAGEYNLNLVGVRSMDKTAAVAFDDALLCLYRVGGLWRVHLWPCTTDPGEHYLQNPINAAGTAILVPSQYRSAYAIGTHRGYDALVQRGLVRVWRDANRDAELNWGTDEGIAGYYGINIHRAAPSGVSDSSAAYSAGCQVLASRHEHDALMTLCKRAGSKTFTYTLLESTDIALDV